jgi:hypothetical protein
MVAATVGTADLEVMRVGEQLSYRYVTISLALLFIAGSFSICGVKKYAQKLHAHPPSSIEC